MAERKYRYRRVEPGLVLLPANDGKTWLVVGRYTDGPTFGLESEPRDFQAWGWGIVPTKMIQRVRAKSDPTDIALVLRDYVFDNTWPRHVTMGDAMDAAVSAVAKNETERS